MSVLLANIINIFIPVFVLLLLFAITCAILVLAAENDIESDKYLKARGKNTSLPLCSSNIFDTYCENEKCCENVYKFINMLYEIFPNDFIIVPNVSLKKFIENYSSLDNFNKDVINKTVDLGIFYKNRQPLVMIDLIDKNSKNESMQKFTKDIAKALSSLNIPVAEVVIEKSFDLLKLKTELLKLMPKHIMKKYL